jgi:antitoxin (DNA-binding transcriptional repressor) of toxin-antitoxin stability system
MRDFSSAQRNVGNDVLVHVSDVRIVVDVVDRGGDVKLLCSRSATEAAASLHRGDRMKTVTVRDLQKSVRDCVDIAQDDHVVITRYGQPAAILVGIEGEEWETVVLQTSASFWRLIERRRKEPTISLEELRANLVKARRRKRRA